MSPPLLHRRALLRDIGALALPLALPPRDPALAGEQSSSVRLIENLFTRVGAAVTLNREGPFVFVIDTGAAQTAIADSLLDRLELTPRRLVRVHGITATELAPSVDIGVLNLAGERFRGLQCPVLPYTLLGADGLLGLDVLSKFRLRFDIQRRAASLTMPGRAAIHYGSSANASRLTREGSSLSRGAFGQMLINQVSTDSADAIGFVDSGAQYSIGNLALRREVVSRADTSLRGQDITLYGVTGQTLPAELRTVADIRLGGRRLGATPLLFADLHCFSVMGLADRPALLIGADLLGRFREVSIDFPRQVITFDGLQKTNGRAMEPLFG